MKTITEEALAMDRVVHFVMGMLAGGALGIGLMAVLS